MIREKATDYAVVELCELMEVSSSGYYAWLKRGPSARLRANQQITRAIEEEHAKSRKSYGSPRIAIALRRRGIPCGKKRVARLMKNKGLKGAQKAPFRPTTTNSRHDDPISPNRLAALPMPEQVNAVWVGDITYIPTQEGWLYLAAFMDRKSRLIKGWAIRDHMRVDLVTEALSQAVWRHRPPRGLIIHSDRGSQYASRTFRTVMEDHGMLGSMSAKGNCYDNAAMESFWSTLKAEMAITRPFQTRDDARRAIFDYIETFYNRSRLHSALDYTSPIDYELNSAA